MGSDAKQRRDAKGTDRIGGWLQLRFVLGSFVRIVLTEENFREGVDSMGILDTERGRWQFDEEAILVFHVRLMFAKFLPPLQGVTNSIMPRQFMLNRTKGLR